MTFVCENDNIKTYCRTHVDQPLLLLNIVFVNIKFSCLQFLMMLSSINKSQRWTIASSGKKRNIPIPKTNPEQNEKVKWLIEKQLK